MGLFLNLLKQVKREGMENLIDFIYVIPYALLGVSFAYMHDKTDNILASIMMHFIHNTAIMSFSILTGMILL